MVAHAWRPNVYVTKAGEPWIPGQPGQHTETPSPSEIKNVFVTEFYNIGEMSWNVWGYSYLHQNLPNHKLWYSHQRLGNLDQHREGSWRQISLGIVTCVLAPGKPTRVDKAQSSPLHRKSALLVPRILGVGRFLLPQRGSLWPSEDESGCFPKSCWLRRLSSNLFFPSALLSWRVP